MSTREKNVPWGISESGYYRFDANMNHQYRAFGVPGLGFKRGLGDDLVVAPYASLLALPIRPDVVMQNVKRFIELDMLGDYGFYEAVDYTPSRLTLDEGHAIVRSFMVHHQGMILLSLVNYLQDNVMVRRFHADPRIQSVELLLQEMIPLQVPIEQPPSEAIPIESPGQPTIQAGPWHVPVHTAAPQAHFLSNGRYGVLITSTGGGYSCWEDVDLTRWRADTTLDDYGTWLYVQDLESKQLWSIGHQPVAEPTQHNEVFFYPHQVDFICEAHDIATDMTVTVAPRDDVEIRRIRVTNQSTDKRHLALTSYSEPILAAQDADRRHPAFNKLFIESEYLPHLNAILLRRRPRANDEEPLYLLHALVIEPGEKATIRSARNRATFLGRGRIVQMPVALAAIGETKSEMFDGPLSASTVATLDPIMALRGELELEGYEALELSFITLAAHSREDALALAERYQNWATINRAFDQARNQSERELRQLDLTSAELEQFQKLLSVLLYPHEALRAVPETLVSNRLGQPALWPYAISGDYPILLVKVGTSDESALVSELLQAHSYWRNRRLKIDLVILNEEEIGYTQEVQGELLRVLTRTGSDSWLNQRGGIFLLNTTTMSNEDRVLLETAARAILYGDAGTLARQLRAIDHQPTYLPPLMPTRSAHEAQEPTPSLLRPADLLFDNGIGGFTQDGKEYVIHLEPEQWTPAPWINVIANPDFGFLISEAGSGNTWSTNSGENRLTPWSNDPVSNTPGEALYLRDEETGAVWSPTPLPARSPAPYQIRHGAGYTDFAHHSHGLKQRVRFFVAPDAPVKIAHVRIENSWQRARRLTATYYTEWVLGVNRDTMQQYIIPEYEDASHALLARNPYNPEFGERVAFVAASKELHGLTANRTEFLGRTGNRQAPAALQRIGLSNVVSPGHDPCAALQIHVDLEPGQAEEFYFLIGQEENREKAVQLIQRFQKPGEIDETRRQVIEFWDGLLGTITVDTPDAAMNIMLNRWLLYQALACRIWGRTALYQSSGAYGFRDQLQDVMALLHAATHLAREQILRTARHQFETGDVLHWWHPPSGRGVRTRISDDLLWLPFVTAHYVSTTGDKSILTEDVPFLRGPVLGADEHERYGLYETTDEIYSIYEHCRRAIAHGRTEGVHGLPLMGGGDWNDGMNRVGIEGRGESVWLGWFLHATMMRFASICRLMNDEDEAETLCAQAETLRRAIEESAWDGNWYRRGFYDDGSLLGSAENNECQIDAIAQSWAVLSGAGDEERVTQAMDAIRTRLVQPDDQLIQLFTPPFDKSPRDPGYIKGYPPGIRENGGQYTHAAIWTVWAFAQMGDGDFVEELFHLLNPIYHAETAEKAKRYQVEPYVIAADVYGVPPHIGRGGWTWYTGSCGWMYQLGIETILGVRREGSILRVAPLIPKNWPSYEFTYRYGRSHYRIRVENPNGLNGGVAQVVVDEKEMVGDEIPLMDDGQIHSVTVYLRTELPD
ncbi:hypothetical protein KFU94_25860 [Chloroflexi bacterium TSY]|nr:hypothetical protein [Chloroflexi bacterium TSY]